MHHVASNILEVVRCARGNNESAEECTKTDDEEEKQVLVGEDLLDHFDKGHALLLCFFACCLCNNVSTNELSDADCRDPVEDDGNRSACDDCPEEALCR